MGFASEQLEPNPCTYCERGGSRVKGMPKASARRAAVRIPPTDLGAPWSIIGLRSIWSRDDLSNENPDYVHLLMVNVWKE